MSVDILLQDDNDIYFDGSDIDTSQENQTISQQLRILLYTHTKEWYYDPNFGVKYIGNIWGEKVNIITINSLIYSAILSIEGIKTFTKDGLYYDFDTKNRILEIQGEVITIYGILPISIPGVTI